MKFVHPRPCSILLIVMIAVAPLVKYVRWTNFQVSKVLHVRDPDGAHGNSERLVFLQLQMRKPRLKESSSYLELGRKVVQLGFNQVLFGYNVHLCGLIEVSSSVGLSHMRFL